MNLKLFFIFSITLIVLDFIWLIYFSKEIGNVITKIQKSPMKINPIAAILAYLIMCISYYYISFENDQPNYLKGALLGLAIYGTYEFTNYATFKDWDLSVLIKDISWGVFLSVASLFISSKLNNLI
jgi:uncharacterized membrane protein